MPLVGQHEVETCALELAIEDQVSIGNNERAVGHVTVRLRDKRLGDKSLGRKGIDMNVRGRAGTLAIKGNRGVKFASVIQPGGTAKRVKI